jgi:hypothetical protein
MGEVSLSTGLADSMADRVNETGRVRDHFQTATPELSTNTGRVGPVREAWIEIITIVRKTCAVLAIADLS